MLSSNTTRHKTNPPKTKEDNIMRHFTTTVPVSLSKKTILKDLNVTKAISLQHASCLLSPEDDENKALYAFFCATHSDYGWTNYPHKPGQEYLYESNEDITQITTKEAYEIRKKEARRLVFLKNPDSDTHSHDYKFLGIYEFDEDYDYMKEKRFRYKLIATEYPLLPDAEPDLAA